MESVARDTWRNTVISRSHACTNHTRIYARVNAYTRTYRHRTERRLCTALPAFYGLDAPVPLGLQHQHRLYAAFIYAPSSISRLSLLFFLSLSFLSVVTLAFRIFGTCSDISDVARLSMLVTLASDFLLPESWRLLSWKT